MMDHPEEACGLFGAYDYDGGEVASILYWGMISQNHRGHQSYGFLTYNGDFQCTKGMGLIPVSQDQSDGQFDDLEGNVGVGHVRYATSGDKENPWKDVQPLKVESGDSKIVIGYNGNVVNNGELKEDLRNKYGSMDSTSDTELLAKKFLEGYEEGGLEVGGRVCMEEIEGSFSVVGVDDSGRLFAFRDPYGIKPLCYGERGDGDVYGVSSESVGLSINGFDYLGEVEPGEMIILDEDGLEKKKIMDSGKKAFCSFEYAYFARPDAIFNEKPVYRMREEFGKNLVRENPYITEKTDIIVSIPKTTHDTAYEMHIETGLPWERALRKHRYITSRSFISSDENRGQIIDRKINIDWDRIKGKNVAVAEDSVVRGSTSKRVVKKMRDAGVGDIHLYVTFPRIISPCFYGIDMTTYEELIGSDNTPEEIAEEIDVDSINYQSIDGFVEATGLDRDELCLGCITNDYPTPRAQKMAEKFKVMYEKGKDRSGRIYER